jgi:molecular chaperone DnaK (HSP70)
VTDSEHSRGIFGIDLGTLYSSVSFIDSSGNPVVTRDAHGECKTPSVVYFRNEGDVVVGRVAQWAAGRHPDQVVSLIRGEMGNADYRQTFFGVDYTPAAISAIILHGLAADAAAYTGRVVTDVVITVPAWFGVAERQATWQAGEIAGLNVIGILPEPVAAALYYQAGGNAGSGTFVVYDLGGKSFDVSLVRLADIEVELLALGGDQWLGGADWDQSLFASILDYASALAGDDSPLDDEATLHDLLTLAETAKEKLSTAESTTVTVPLAGTDVDITLTRAEFEQATARLLNRTLKLTQLMLADAESSHPGIRQQISGVLLAGGASLMPAVAAGLKRVLGLDVRTDDPAFAVAKGAALYAAGQTVRHLEMDAGAGSPSRLERVTETAIQSVADQLGIGFEDVSRLAQRNVVNTLARSLGIKLVDTSQPDWQRQPEAASYVEHVLHASQELPATYQFTAATINDGQEMVQVDVYEQAGARESPSMADNRRVVEGAITGIAQLPAGTPIDITMSVDGEGKLSLSAVESVSGQRLDVEARLGALDEEQVESAKLAVAALAIGGVRAADAAGADTGRADTGGADTGGADTGGADTGGAAAGRPGPSPGAGATAGEGALPRRFLAVDLPERAPAGARVSVLVRIVLAAAGTQTSAPLKPFAVPPAGARVTISVSAPALIALGDLEQEVLVPAHADSEPVRFAFRTAAVGLHTVTVRAFAGGTFLGELAAQMSVELAVRLKEGPTRTADIGAAVAEPGEVTLQVNRDGDLYSFQLISETWYPAQLSTRLAGDPAEAVEALVAELRGMAAGRSSYSSPALVRARLRNLGARLWADAVPAAVHRQFWEQSDRITSFCVASDLDTIPWELLYPVDGQHELGFLCEHYPLTRRVYGQGRARTLRLSSAAYVVPRGSPDDAMDEVARVRARLGPQTSDQGVLDSLHGLTAVLDDASTSVLHFACHNTFTNADGSLVTMADGPFRPSDLSLAVQRKALSGSEPLIFFNGCRSAGEIPGFTKMMGWARQFMSAGAGAFLGSLWPVRSSSAHDFADAFYAAFVMERRPLGEATRAARTAISDDIGDPTWLAYTLYGNPAATAARHEAEPRQSSG